MGGVRPTPFENDPDMDLMVWNHIAKAIAPFHATVDQVLGTGGSHRVRAARRLAIQSLTDWEIEGYKVLNPEEVAAYFGRDRTTIYHYLEG